MCRIQSNRLGSSCYCLQIYETGGARTQLHRVRVYNSFFFFFFFFFILMIKYATHPVEGIYTAGGWRGI